MAIINRERVGKGLELLAAGLQPFVERELRSILGEKWQDPASELPREGAASHKTQQINWLDTQVLLGVLWNHWNAVFHRTLGPAERSLVSELRDARNRWAHNESFGGNDAHRSLDSMGRLLTAVSATQAAEVEQLRIDLLRVQFVEQRRSEMRKSSFQPTEGKPQGGLKPWREVVTPHPDVWRPAASSRRSSPRISGRFIRTCPSTFTRSGQTSLTAGFRRESSSPQPVLSGSLIWPLGFEKCQSPSTRLRVGFLRQCVTCDCDVRKQ